MKSVIRYALVAASLLACSASAWAQDTTVSFSGTITLVDPGNPFPDITVGMPFCGSYTFNASTPDSNGMTQVGDYWHYSAPYGVTVTVGSHVFKTDPANVNFVVEYVNDYNSSDNITLHSYNNLATDGVPVPMISWQLDDPTQTALTSPDITATAPDMTKWQQFFGFDITAGDPHGMTGLIRGHVDQAQLGTGATCPIYGELKMLAAGTPAPAGYTLVGTYSLPADPTNPNPLALSVDVYRKN